MSLSDVKDSYRILFAIYDISKAHRWQQVWLPQISNYFQQNKSYESELLGICNNLKDKGLLEFKYIGPGIIITNYGIKEVEESIINPNNATINFPARIVDSVSVTGELYNVVQTIRRIRTEFLHELYRMTEGKESVMVNPSDIAKNISIDQADMNKAYWYLLDEGLIEFRYNGGGISITKLGIETILEEKANDGKRGGKDYISLITQKTSGYRNDLPKEVNRLLDLSIDKFLEEDESAYLEFKSSLFWDHKNNVSASKDLQVEYIKSIPAFMNSHGGILVIGIDKDNDRLLGLSKDFSVCSNFDKWRLSLSGNLYGRGKIDQFLSDYIEVIKKTKNTETFALIIVKKTPLPVWISIKDRDVFYIRNDNRTVPLEGRQQHFYIKGHFE